MKRIALWLSASVLISGCNLYQSQGTTPATASGNTMGNTAESACGPTAGSGQPEGRGGSGSFPDLESLLAFREQVCQLSEQERMALRDQYRRAETDENVMSQLMLATCRPDQTPGLLANSLVLARNIEETPRGFDALLQLLSAESRSYALLEQRLRDTEQRLENTIEGIRAIEAEMGKGVDTSREAPDE